MSKRFPNEPRGQRINMTFEELKRRMKVAQRSLEDVPHQVRPLMIARDLGRMVVTPCHCQEPDCMYPYLSSLVDAAKAFSDFCDTHNKLPMLAGISVVKPGEA